MHGWTFSLGLQSFQASQTSKSHSAQTIGLLNAESFCEFPAIGRQSDLGFE